MFRKEGAMRRKIQTICLSVGGFGMLSAFVWLVLFCLPYFWGIKEGGRVEILTLFALMFFSSLLLVIGLSIERADSRRGR